MIISVRGASGSGKTHLVRQVMREYDGPRTTITYPAEERRRRPMGCVLGATPGPRLFVPGHYEIVNGGVDTLPTLDYAYRLIREHHELGFSVLYEGKNMSDGWQRVTEMHASGLPVRVVLLTTPLSECVASVRARGHQISEKSIQRVYDKCLRDAEHMRARGVPCFRLSRERALSTVRGWLR